MRWLPPLILAAVLLGHFGYVTDDLGTAGGSGPWAAYDFDAPEEPRLTRYLESGDY